MCQLIIKKYSHLFQRHRTDAKKNKQEKAAGARMCQDLYVRIYIYMYMYIYRGHTQTADSHTFS